MTEAAIIRKGYGDVESAFRNAHAIVELDLSVGRHSGVPMETRGAIGRYDAARDILEMYGAAKVPHWNRDQLARMLGRNPSSMHLHEGHVGGGFGIRGELYPEDVLVCAAALRLGRPVKWIEDRREHLIAANHSRQQRHRIRAAIDEQGRILAIDDEFFHDQGAYVRTHGGTVPDLAAAMLLGPYRIPNYRVAGHIRLTNKTPAGTYRAPGRFESTFVRERLMDAIAAKAGLSPLEVRRRNFIASAEMPYDRQVETLGTHVVFDSGDYAGLLDKTLERIGWPALQGEIKARRDQGRTGRCGSWHLRREERAWSVRQCEDRGRYHGHSRGRHRRCVGRAGRRDGDRADLRADARRRLRARARGAWPDRPHRLRPRRLRVARDGDDRRGNAACGAQGPARRRSGWRPSCCRARRKTSTSSMARSEERGKSSGPSISVAEIARHLLPSSRTRGDREPGLSGEGWFFTDHMNYPYGVHVAVVRIDRDTGHVEVERYLVAYDIGRAVNPMLVEGQIAGGFAQGIGGSLFEEFTYDERGEPLNVTFADYLMPTAREVPDLDVLICEDAPSPLNPLGLKGAGEGGTNAVGAAVASAIDDALQRPGAVTQLPVTPQRLKEIIDRAGR